MYALDNENKVIKYLYTKKVENENKTRWKLTTKKFHLSLFLCDMFQDKFNFE